MKTLRLLLRPSAFALGYALFLATNATSVWGGVFPFLPVDFQTHDILLWFFFAQASVFSLAFVASVFGSYRFPTATRAFLVYLAGIPYFLGWCCLIAAIYLPAHALPLSTCGGALLGLGSAGFYMLWQRLFAGRSAEHGNRDLIVGTAWAAIFYAGLYLIPRAVTSFLIPILFLPLFGLAIVLKSRTIDLRQPMFDDVPREHPAVYRRAIADVWRSALCMGALGLCTGIMRAVAVSDPQVGSYVNVISMAALFVAAVGLLALWSHRDFTFNVLRLYRVLFPLVISAFALMLVMPAGYVRYLAAFLYALHSMAILLMMMQCAQISRDRGINPVFIYGFFGGVMFALHDLGFIGANFVEMHLPTGSMPMTSIALVAVYLLSIMYFVGQGGFGQAVGALADANRIELLAIDPAQSEEAPDAEHEVEFEEPAEPEPQPARDKPGASDGRAEGQPVFIDRTSKQVELLRRQFRLSAREAEVVDLLARGNTVARIAEELFVSENTIRTHTKRIYQKLDIHKKQELNDLLQSLDPSEL